MFIRQSFLFIFLCFFGFSKFSFSQDEDQSQSPDTNGTIGMSYVDASIYGLVEGITEFLPISSTGHLILVSEFLKKEGGEDEYTEAINAYLIVIQAGAILSVALIYRKELWSIALGVLGLDPRGRRLGLNLFLAFLPAALVGPFLDDSIETLLFGLLPIAFALFAGALLMWWVEFRKKKQHQTASPESEKTLDDLSWKNSLFIGIMQCIAMWPGTSRSMMTIVAGYLVGLQRAKAAEFSFLLGLITLTAAAGYKAVTKWEIMTENLQLGPVFWGCFVAGISAALSVYWLVGYLSRRGLGIFVWYRILLSMIVLYFYLT